MGTGRSHHHSCLIRQKPRLEGPLLGQSHPLPATARILSCESGRLSAGCHFPEAPRGAWPSSLHCHLRCWCLCCWNCRYCQSCPPFAGTVLLLAVCAWCGVVARGCRGGAAQQTPSRRLAPRHRGSLGQRWEENCSDTEAGRREEIVSFQSILAGCVVRWMTIHLGKVFSLGHMDNER